MTKPVDPVPARIFTIRGHRVILDADLARLYGVPTFRLNEAAKRNAGKFPEDFRFQLTHDELADLISQSAISSAEPAADQDSSQNSSQPVISRHGGLRKLPWVFTEHGALMAANVLRSPHATEMAIYVVRAFVKQREALTGNAVILKRLADGARQRGDGVVERSETARMRSLRVNQTGALGRFGSQIDKTLLEHDSGLRMLWHRLQPLLAPPPPPPEPPKRKIGYHEGNR
jgi:hypothetical protein